MKTKGAGVQNQVICDFVFEGGLQSSERATLVKEILKYLLYERQQIPLPVEHIKRELKSIHDSENENETRNQPVDTVVQGKNRGPKNGLRKERTRYNRLELKRATKVLDNLEEICGHLTNAFEICPEITQVLLAFGGTVISPKESYFITFPLPNLDDEIMSVKSCVRSLLKQIIMHDMHRETKSLTPTNMTVLLNAPRDSGINWFLPKPNLRSPSRGKLFQMNINCKSKFSTSSYDLSRDEREIEISGIEPFDIMDVDVSDMDSSGSLIFTPGGHISTECIINDTPTRLSTTVDTSVQSETDIDAGRHEKGATGDEEMCLRTDIEHIWFQSPCTVRGYRDRTSRHASMMS